jgi:hypothetical protein
MLETFPPVNPRQQVPPLPPDRHRPAGSDEDATEATRQRIRQLPPEVGAVLLGVGFVGLIIPGPVGTPLILAGGIALIPSVFGRVESWLHKKFPKSHRVGMKYVDRFIDDYEKRFPRRTS